MYPSEERNNATTIQAADLIIKSPACSLYVLLFLMFIVRFIEVPELTRGFQFVFLRNQEGSQIAEEGKEKQ